MNNKYLSEENFEKFFYNYKNQYGLDYKEKINIKASDWKDAYKGFWKSKTFLWSNIIIWSAIIWFSFVWIMGGIGQTKENLAFEIVSAIMTVLMLYAIAMIIVFIVYIFGELKSKKNERYENSKLLMYNKLLQCFNKDLVLGGKEKIAEMYKSADMIVEYTGLFDSKKDDSFSFEDIVTGCLKKKGVQDFCSCEIDVKKIVYHDKETHSDEYVSIFKGLYCKYEMSKNIEGTLKVLSDKKENDEIMKIYSKEDKANIVHMDSSEFENRFDVISNNGVIAMKILTADVMQELIDLSEIFKFEMVFKDNYMYVRIKEDKLFELYKEKKIGIEKYDEEEVKAAVKKTYMVFAKLLYLIDLIEEILNRTI